MYHLHQANEKKVIKYLEAFLLVISIGLSVLILSIKLFIADPELPKTLPNLTILIFLL